MTKHAYIHHATPIYAHSRACTGMMKPRVIMAKLVTKNVHCLVLYVLYVDRHFKIPFKHHQLEFFKQIIACVIKHVEEVSQVMLIILINPFKPRQ